MSQQQKTTVQRTLVLTGGPLAEQAGQHFRELLDTRAGPVEAVAIVSTNPAAGEALPAQITEALTAISPPSLATDLARKGWVLEAIPEVIIFLVLDAAAYNAAEARLLQEIVTTLLQQHLGLDATALVLWLVGDLPVSGPQIDGAYSGNVANTLSPGLDQTLAPQHGVFTLSLLNEEGLRLPDEAALAALAANALWALVATPLRRAPEWLLANVSYSLPAPMPFASLGIGHWSWSSSQTRQVFITRWLSSVLACWVATPDHLIAEDEVRQWLEYRQFDAAALSPRLLYMADQAVSTFAAEAWSVPAPWQIRRLWHEMKVEAEVEQATLEWLAEQVAWRLADWLETATATLRAHLQALLDDSPNAGVELACAWAAAATHTFDDFCAALCQRTEEEATVASELAAEQGKLAGQLQELLEAWPPPHPLAWAILLMRPWRWPRLIWRYLRLRRCGYELSQTMVRQARLQRQQLLTATCRQGMATLHQEARHLHGQTEEIGDMLRYLCQQVGAGEPSDPATASPVPLALYEQLIGDEAAEATAAAAAVGGLGRQLTALDDGILDTLRRLANERLARLNDVTAIEALAALCTSPAEWQQWWQALWAEATPMWRYDEAALGAEARNRQRSHAWICGAGVRELPHRLQAAVELPPDIQWHSSADRERILLLRLHSGLAAAAMTGREKIEERN